jgi:spermidine synthase
MHAHMTLARSTRAALSGVAFLSGAAGLVFEVVWFHRTGLVLGNSVWAATIVLSSFMAGLALGAALISGLRPTTRVLRTYAIAESVVAVSGIALAYALPHLTAAIVPLARAAGNSPGTVNLLRLAAAFIVMLVPSTAMGATLPLLVGALSERGATVGDAFGTLYGWNTIGAVSGVMGAEIVLVDRLGVAGSAWVAGGLDLAAAAGALLLVGSARGADVARGFQPSVTGPLTPLARTCLACACLSGGLLLALEVIWFRCLTMYVLSTTLAASEMLAVVLAGIGAGGLAASTWLAGRARATSAIPAAALATGFSVLTSYFVLQTSTTGTQVGDWTRVLWFACVLTGSASFGSGVLLTLLAEALAPAVTSATRAAAMLTVANTAGAMIGPPIAAFVLLPAVGMERALIVLAGLYLIVAVVALRIDGARFTLARLFTLAAGGAVVVAAFAFSSSARAFARAANAYAGDGSVVISAREGPSETVFVMQQPWLGKPVYSRLVTNGFSMSGTTVPAMRYMRDFAYWPMLLHDGPLTRALVICYGVGVTVGAVADIPSLTSLDVVEISRTVVDASRWIYPPPAHAPLDDPRVRLHLDDGRFFLQATTERFDLITGEPPPPRTPGAVNIYTREYFQLVHDRLADGGMTTYWVPVARPDPGTDVNTIVRAFCDVFDDCSLWNGTPSDFMLVGTRHAAGPVTASAFAAPWKTPALAARLQEIGFERPEQIGATFLGDAAFLRELTASTPPLTDDFPQRLLPLPSRPSLSDPRYRSDPDVIAMYERVLDPARARRAFETSPLIQRLWPRDLAAATLPFFDTQRILNRAIWEGGRPLEQIDDLHRVLTQTTLEALPLWLLGSDEVKQQIAENARTETGEPEYAKGLRALATRHYMRAAAFLGEAERRGANAPAVRPLQVYALCLAGDLDTARLLARGLARGAQADRFRVWLRSTFNL